jgi:CheY-like chemotaxis protein
MHATATGSTERPRIFHVSSRENIKGLRDEILRLHGYEVESILFSGQVLNEVAQKEYDLVLIDVESDVRVQSAQELCDAIKKVIPGQHIAFVCNYRVGIESDCPDEIIRAEFNPEALVRGVQQALGKNDKANGRPAT